MKALLLDAARKPRETYRFSEQDPATKTVNNMNQGFHNLTLRMIYIPVPASTPDEILVKVCSTGVCGSDARMYQKDEDGYTAHRGHCKLSSVLITNGRARQIDLLLMITARYSLDQAIEAIHCAEKLMDAKVMVVQ